MPIPNNEQGQSTIEFVLSLSLALGITMLFVSQAVNMTIGFMVHYGTYMGGRTYLSYDSFNPDNAQVATDAGREAERAFKRYGLEVLDINPVVEVVNKQSTSLFTGITAKYEKLLSPFRLVLNGEKAVFYSEGFLGKEPSRTSCNSQVCFAVGASGTCSASMDVTLYDNGC